MLSIGQQGDKEPPRVSQPHDCWGVVAKNVGICWNRIILFISFFTIKIANLKISGFMEKTSCFFHIPRFCRFLNFKVFIIRNIFPN